MNTAMIYMLLFGAVSFSFFIGVSQLPQMLVAAIQAAHLPPLRGDRAAALVYLLLGFVMDPITTLFVTVPVVGAADREPRLRPGVVGDRHDCR